MTIHSTHPFETPGGDRDQLRRFRARTGGTVSLWTAGGPESDRSGLTVSSYLVAAGEPGHLLAVVDPESDLLATVLVSHRAVVQLLEWGHQQVAEMFAGQFPSPGGLFRGDEWEQTEWGPRLRSASTWVGLRFSAVEPRDVGYTVLLDGEVEAVTVGDEIEPLVHLRGRYVRPPS
jgi:flavin reductase (DIM6/NTAB) family NADH-FMN oxidoreductase RutF